MLATLVIVAVVLTVLSLYSILLLAVFCPAAYDTGYADCRADEKRDQKLRESSAVRILRSVP